MKMSPSLTLVVAAMATSFSMHVAVARTANKKVTATETSTALAEECMNYSDRERMKYWSGEKGKLEQALKVGASKADYMKVLANNGYMASKQLSNGDAYSDRANSKGWTDQKEKLE